MNELTEAVVAAAREVCDADQHPCTCGSDPEGTCSYCSYCSRFERLQAALAAYDDFAEAAMLCEHGTRPGQYCETCDDGIPAGGYEAHEARLRAKSKSPNGCKLNDGSCGRVAWTTEPASPA